MKNKFLAAVFLSILMSISFISCSNNDDSSNSVSTETKIKGKWRIFKVDMIRENSSSSTYYPSNGDCPNEAYEFLDNHVLEFEYFIVSTNGNQTQCDDNSILGNWHYSNDELKLQLSIDDEVVYKITELTNDKLTLEQKDFIDGARYINYFTKE